MGKKNKKQKNHYDNEKLFNRFGFRTIQNHPDMGLNNMLCEDKYAICKYKRVYLTKAQCQKCLNQMDYMMMEKKVCYYLKINIKEDKNMIEILGKSLDICFKELNIDGKEVYQGKDYSVYQINEMDFEKINKIDDDDWKEEWGFWRYAKGSNITNTENEFIINGKKIIAWDGYNRLDDLEAAILNNNEDDEEYYSCREYVDLLEYMCEEIGASQPKNICALAVDLAKMNNITMGELFTKYQN